MARLSKRNPKAPTSFFRDARAIAVAWGLTVLRQRHRRHKQLEPVKAAMARADFPKKQKRGWSRPEVELFGKKFVRPAKDARSLTVSDSPQSTVVSLDVDQTGELFLTPEQALQGRLDRLQEMYLHPEKFETKIAQWEVEELRVHRPQIWSRNAELADGASIRPHGDCNSITEVARVIAQHFEVDCRKQYVSDWRQGKRLPTGVPLLPPPDPKSNRYDVPAVLAWYEKYILKRVNGAAVTRDMGMVLVDERDKAELEEIEHQRWLREKERGEYVHRTVALATGVAAVKRLHQMVKAEDERNLPRQRREKLLSLGVVAGLAAQFEIWDIELARLMTDRRELQMTTAAAPAPTAKK